MYSRVIATRLNECVVKHIFNNSIINLNFYSMLIEKRIYNQKDGEIIPLTTTANGKKLHPNPKCFNGRYGYLYQADGVNAYPLMFITSYRDTLEHKTLWALMDKEGTTYWVDCLKVKPLNMF